TKLDSLQFKKCISGPCNYHIPDIYVDFIQGGNNLEGLYMILKDGQQAHWNPLLAILHSVNTPAAPGRGDEQNVVCKLFIV
uniref:Chromo domain-containing protein n=1 Tax=Syphacia muris TaxID=451379 RepID=A0A0N5AZG7_9BILA